MDVWASKTVVQHVGELKNRIAKWNLKVLDLSSLQRQRWLLYLQMLKVNPEQYQTLKFLFGSEVKPKETYQIALNKLWSYVLFSDQL